MFFSLRQVRSEYLAHIVQIFFFADVDIIKKEVLVEQEYKNMLVIL